MEEEIPNVIERDGKLLVLQPHQVSIQSAEGQRYLAQRHEATMSYLEAYPNLREHLFTDNWAAGFIEGLCARKEDEDEATIALVGYPCFYCAASQMTIGIHPKDYLARADEAIAFLAEKAPKRNRQDLFNNLLKSVSLAAEFEVMLAWALLQHFGKDAVKPYARVSDEGDQNIDFAVVRGDARVFIEATVLLDDKAREKANRYNIAHGIDCTIEGGDDRYEVERLRRKCHDKVHQRRVKDPLILCVGQRAAWPDPATGTEVAGKLVAGEMWAEDSMLVGVAYFYAGNLVSTHFAESRFRKTDALAALVNDARSALGRLASQAQVDAARAQSPARAS